MNSEQALITAQRELLEYGNRDVATRMAQLRKLRIQLLRAGSLQEVTKLLVSDLPGETYDDANEGLGPLS